MKCSFCGKEIPKGEGYIYAKKDGTTYYFCSRKCRKNMLMLKRERKKVRWTEEAKKLKQKRKARKG